MYRQLFGKKGQVHFDKESDYYLILGYLAKSIGITKLVFEHNEDQGAWGPEARIEFFNDLIPLPDVFDYSAGVGNIKKRLNCNDYIKNLVEDHHFIFGKIQNIDVIRKTIPEKFISEFNNGLRL